MLSIGNRCSRAYPKIKKRAKREKAEIYWEDETVLRSDHQTGRTYSPEGKTPIIRGTGKRFSCNIISAINNRGRMRFQVFKGGFNQLTYPTMNIWTFVVIRRRLRAPRENRNELVRLAFV